METKKKIARYKRLHQQIGSLLAKPGNAASRMATVVAVLHHKMEYFFWTGFYCLDKGDLIVAVYQGPVACQLLERNVGVCWAGINSNQAIIVPDVHQFPGHIACDSRSRSEIVVPVRDSSGFITGVLDVDSRDYNAFDETDAEWLEKILRLI